MAIPSYMYGNPETVLSNKQQHKLKKSCAGCVFSFKIELAGVVQNGCEKGNKFGRRCKSYKKG